MTSSRFGIAVLLYLMILVTADMAFSVGLTFSGSRLLSAEITSTKREIYWAHVMAN